MTATKVVFIVLIVIVVLFIALAVWGSTNAKKPQPTPDKLLDSFNELLSPFAPKLALAQKSFDLSKVGSGASIPVTIPKDASQNFRIAKFNISPPGCARMEYQTADGKGGDLHDQSYPKQGTKPDPAQASFTILASGGTLTITHAAAPPQPCVVKLD